MGYVFVSYSSRDKERADLIIQAITAAGIDVWIDRVDIKAGQTWRVQIVQAIDTCEAFIIIVSSNSTISENVPRELDLAQDSDRPIFPLLLEPVKSPPEMRYQLTGPQFIDFHQVGFEKGIKQLLGALHEVLGNRGG